MQMSEVYSTILKQGIRESKYKNSKIHSIKHKPEGIKGSIFAFRSKELMSSSRGIVFTSEEALLNNQQSLSHWTPNVYSYGTYTDSTKTVVQGHFEKNLRQINTFVIDIDLVEGQSLSESSLINHCISDEFGFLPTLIIKTPHGYQLYFVLESAWFISNKNNYASISVAKNVSNSIRAYFGQVFPVDFACNHFGIARFPSVDNVVFYESNMVCNMQTLIAWSMKYAPKKKYPRNHDFHVISTNGFRQVNEPWVNLLMHTRNIHGDKGIKGRNNLVFTLSLAFYSSGKSYQECFDAMDEFNSCYLEYSLSNNELEKIINSAYSGNYHAANRKFVRELATLWGGRKYTDVELFGTAGWYKFKKTREERKNSHFSEWKDDLRKFFRNGEGKRPYLVTSKKEITKILEIPSRSLDHVLKEMQAAGEIYLKSKRGRNGGIRIATRESLIRTIILDKQQKNQAAREKLLDLFPEARAIIVAAQNCYFSSQGKYQAIELQLVDTS